MRNYRMKTVLAGAVMAAGACLFMSESSNAQADSTCANKVFINSIYSVGNAPYDYMVQIQNRSSQKRNVTITGDGFGQHPNNWQQWYVDPQVLAPGAVVTVKIGTGTNGSLSASNTAFYYDKPTNFRSPSVAVNNCSVAN